MKSNPLHAVRRSCPSASSAAKFQSTQTVALQELDPAYVADGSLTSFLSSRRVRFAPRADIPPMPAYMSTR